MTVKTVPNDHDQKQRLTAFHQSRQKPAQQEQHFALKFFANNRNVGWYSLLCVIAVTFYGFNVLAPLMSDDYNYAFSFMTNQRIRSVFELFPSIVAHYQIINGRVSMHFLAQLMLLLGKPVFNVINTAVSVALLLSLCRLTSGKARDPRQLAVWACALLILLPTLGQVMFWLVGACNYLWGLVIIIGLMIPFRDGVLGEGKPLTWWKIGLLLPAYFIMGTVSENSAPAAILLMVLCCALQIHFHRKVSLWQWAAILLSLAGFAFMLLSPASQGRNASSLSQTASLLGRYLVPFTNCVTTFIQYEAVPSAVFLMLFSYSLHLKADQKILALSVAMFVCGIAANFAMTATGYYPLRAMTGSLTFILSASAILLPKLRLSPIRPLLRGAEWALCLMSVLLVLQAAPLTYDRYREASAREARVIAMRDAGELDVATTNISSKTKFDVFYDMIDLTDDPDYFANAVFARYYGLHSVVINELR